MSDLTHQLIHVSVSHGERRGAEGLQAVNWSDIFSSDDNLRDFILCRPQSHWAKSFFKFLYDTAIMEFGSTDDEYLYQFYPFVSDIASTRVR